MVKFILYTFFAFLFFSCNSVQKEIPSKKEFPEMHHNLKQAKSIDYSRKSNREIVVSFNGNELETINLIEQSRFINSNDLSLIDEVGTIGAFKINKPSQKIISEVIDTSYFSRKYSNAEIQLLIQIDTSNNCLIFGYQFIAADEGQLLGVFTEIKIIDKANRLEKYLNIKGPLSNKITITRNNKYAFINTGGKVNEISEPYQLKSEIIDIKNSKVLYSINSKELKHQKNDFDFETINGKAMVNMGLITVIKSPKIRQERKKYFYEAYHFDFEKQIIHTMTDEMFIEGYNIGEELNDKYRGIINRQTKDTIRYYFGKDFLTSPLVNNN